MVGQSRLLGMTLTWKLQNYARDAMERTWCQDIKVTELLDLENTVFLESGRFGSSLGLCSAGDLGQTILPFLDQFPCLQW